MCHQVPSGSVVGNGVPSHSGWLARWDRSGSILGCMRSTAGPGKPIVPWRFGPGWAPSEESLLEGKRWAGSSGSAFCLPEIYLCWICCRCLCKKKERTAARTELADVIPYLRSHTILFFHYSRSRWLSAPRGLSAPPHFGGRHRPGRVREVRSELRSECGRTARTKSKGARQG